MYSIRSGTPPEPSSIKTSITAVGDCHLDPSHSEGRRTAGDIAVLSLSKVIRLTVHRAAGVDTFNVSFPPETAAEQIARFGRQVIEVTRGL